MTPMDGGRVWVGDPDESRLGATLRPHRQGRTRLWRTGQQFVTAAFHGRAYITRRLRGQQRIEQFQIGKALHGTATHVRVRIFACRPCQHIRRRLTRLKRLAADTGIRMFPPGFEETRKHFSVTSGSETTAERPHIETPFHGQINWRSDECNPSRIGAKGSDASSRTPECMT